MKKKPSKRQNRRNNPHAAPLGASIGQHLGTVCMPILADPTPQMPRMPSPPRSARDVLALLTAATGLAVAARPYAKVELLPGHPTTVIITCHGQIEAVFVLPLKASEVLKALGKDTVPKADLDLLALWEEERQAEQITPEVQLDRAREAAQC